MDDAAGLTKIVEYISTLTAQFPPNFRSETNKIQFIGIAALSRSLAKRGIGTVTTARYTFNGFFTPLRKQLQLKLDKRTRALATPSPASLSPTLYQRHGRVP